MPDKPADDSWSLKKTSIDRTYKSLPLETLQTWIIEARIDPDDLLMGPGDKTWRRADEIPEIAKYFAPEGGGEVITGGTFGSRQLFGQKGEGELAVDLTPFIDITFLLLIFFVVTAQFQNQAMKIDPPKAENTSAAKQEKLVLVISKSGQVYLGTREVALSDLKQVIKDEMRRTRQRAVVIRGDQGSKHGTFVRVLDACKAANVGSILVGAAKQKSE